MPRTQKVQVRLDKKKAEQNQAVSAKKAHIKEFDPNANIMSPKGRESVKNSSRMRRLKLVPGYYWPMAHYLGVAHFPAGYNHDRNKSDTGQTAKTARINAKVKKEQKEMKTLLNIV
ncbi:hypothetical protein C8J57DRAFT_1236756 [Mycena rebaudengoi]|nr:hypothetical protein C8J57DRAFT_1236756 [Mycena rebaudengoi]